MKILKKERAELSAPFDFFYTIEMNDIEYRLIEEAVRVALDDLSKGKKQILLEIKEKSAEVEKSRKELDELTDWAYSDAIDALPNLRVEAEIISGVLDTMREDMEDPE